MSQTVLHKPTGRRLRLIQDSAFAWSDSPATYIADGIPVSEHPGSIDGSVFGFWIGHSLPDSREIEERIEAFIGDHDVVAVRFIRALPKDCHSALRGVCRLAA